MADSKNTDLDVVKESIENKSKKQATRRGFLKKALIAGVAVTATAGIAKKTAKTLLPEGDHQKEYLNDVLPGDKVLAQREYVLMTKSEKEELVKTLESGYKKQA